MKNVRYVEDYLHRSAECIGNNPVCQWWRERIGNPLGVKPVPDGTCRRCGGLGGYACEEDMSPPDDPCYALGDPVACPECRSSTQEVDAFDWP